MSKPTSLQYSYKKKTGYTEQQRLAFKTLESYGVNVNQFIRAAVKEKIKKEWKSIKDKRDKYQHPF